MISLYRELRELVRSLNEARADVALCGGLAIAVHREVRATIDIDFVVAPDRLELVTDVCRKRGFTIEAFIAWLKGKRN